MMKEKKLIIVGAGEFAEIAYEYFTFDSSYEVVAFSVENAFLAQNQFHGLPVVPFEEVETLYDPADHAIFVAVTFIQLNRVRTRLYQAAKAKGYKIASYVSSRAFIWKNVSIGENCFIFENNVIQPFVTLGNNIILWSGNHIGHHSKLDDNSFISSHVVISGCCKIGKNCFLGVNSTLIDHIEIGNDCMIAAGALVISNTRDGNIYKGHPAKAAEKNAFSHFNVDKLQV